MDFENCDEDSHNPYEGIHKFTPPKFVPPTLAGYYSINGKPYYIDVNGEIHFIKTDRVLLKSQAKELLKRVPLTGYFNQEEVKIIKEFLDGNS